MPSQVSISYSRSHHLAVGHSLSHAVAQTHALVGLPQPQHYNSEQIDGCERDVIHLEKSKENRDISPS
jgi:hypothetical protein